VLTNSWQADMNDKSTLRKAIEGASAVYAVTNYWETMDQELEVKQGKALVDAAKEAGVQHFIWSSLLNVSKGESVPRQYFSVPRLGIFLIRFSSQQRKTPSRISL